MSNRPFYSLFESDLYERDLRALGPGQLLTDSIVTYGLRRMRYIGIEGTRGEKGKVGERGEKRERDGDGTEVYIQQLLSELFPAGVTVRPSMNSPERDQSVLLMSPTAGMCLRTQCHDDEDHEMLEEGVQLRSRRWMLCVITDNCDQDSSSSHFSLIVADLRNINNCDNDNIDDEEGEKSVGKGKGKSGIDNKRKKGRDGGRSCVYHLDSHSPYNSEAADHMRRALEVHLNR